MRIRQEQTEEEGQLNLMPLIDMVFLLLIFFLVATTFAQEERDLSIKLPGTGRASALSSPQQQLIINIQADGSIKVGPERVEPNRLAEMLADVAVNQPNREVLIRADERSWHKYFAGVADLCRRCGISEVNIGFLLKEPKPVNVR